MSFDKIETAVRARELIKKISTNQAKQESPRKLIGRMMSVDLPRLQGTVWFPGDSQPIIVSIFANAVPADWQHKDDRDGQDSSLAGHGSVVVVERLNGILWVTQVLTGGSAAIDFKTLGLNIMAMNGAPTQAGGPTADAIIDIAGRPHETFINVSVFEDELEVGEAIEFGPFTTAHETTPFQGMIEISVILGDSARIYEMAANISEDFDIDNVNYPQSLWARLIPKHEHGARWYPSASRAYGSEYALDVCLRRTAYGNTEYFSGYREMWFRIVKMNEWENVPGINAYVTLHSTCFQRGRSLGGRELFMQEKIHRPSFPVGYVGFHESGMGPTLQLSNFSDNFGRVLTDGGSWGLGDSVNNTNWALGGAAGTYLVDGESASMDITAVSTSYEMWNYVNANTQPDVTFKVQCPVVATGASFRVAFIHAQDAGGANSRNMFGLDFKTSGNLDLTARRVLAGVGSDMQAPTSAGFTYSAGSWIKIRIRVYNNHANSQTIWMKCWPDGDPEPLTWQKNFVYTNGAGVFYNGYLGFYAAAESANTNTKPVRIKFAELNGVNSHENWAGHGEYWYTGPWRRGLLRTATDLQKTFTYTGNFSWNGTYLKLPTKITLTGVGRQSHGLAAGLAEIFMNPDSQDENILHYPFRSTEGGTPYLTVTYSQGIPLAVNESLWCGIEPGAGHDNFFRYLFIVDSTKEWESSIPEWAVLIAARGPSDAVPQLRLGSGEVLDSWRAPSFGTNWSNYASGYDTAGYRMEANGVVRLKGLVKNTSTSATTTIFTLPAGFCPTASKMFVNVSSAATTSGLSRIDITNTGTVTPVVHFSGTGGAGFLSLEGITFNTMD